ncbi:MAG: putative toxin-antitoxin system toxin component, PIN family [Prevotella sp.]|nr:putative toxin-antitoxin system toxin component, PIN family [Prevotella sp.]
MIYAVIDTNVFVSALLSRYADSATVQVVNAMFINGICPLYNQEIIDEYQNVLHRQKFCFPAEAIDSIINAVQEFGICLDRTRSSEFFPDPKDVVFYEVALSKEDAYLVTGNTKHFPKTPIVVTPSEMMKILQK